MSFPSVQVISAYNLAQIANDVAQTLDEIRDPRNSERYLWQDKAEKSLRLNTEYFFYRGSPVYYTGGSSYSLEQSAQTYQLLNRLGTQNRFTQLESLPESFSASVSVGNSIGFFRDNIALRIFNVTALKFLDELPKYERDFVHLPPAVRDAYMASHRQKNFSDVTKKEFELVTTFKIETDFVLAATQAALAATYERINRL